jgi:hypothetical protein
MAQAGSPAEVYAAPDDLTVAGLTGPVSVLHAPVSAAAAGRYAIEVGGVRVTVSGGAAPGADLPAGPAGSAGHAGPAILVRPDWARLACPAGPGTDGPGADGPGADGPGADGPGADSPGADGSGADGSGADSPGPHGSGADGGGDLPGAIIDVRFRGPHTDYHVATPAGPLLIREPGPPRAGRGAVRWSLLRVRLMPGDG